MEKIIRQVIATLDNVEIRGQANLSRLLGCIQALQKVADALAENRKTMEQTSQPEVNNDGVSN